MGIRASVTGFALGSAAMYLMDPDRGKRRRALLRDKLDHSGRVLKSALGVTSRDLGNRVAGAKHKAEQFFASQPPSDEKLAARVRSKMGRIVSHPSAIEVSSEGGVVKLKGPILEHELNDLLSCVGSIPGVREVHEELEPHRTAGNVPGLQGGRRRPGERPEFLQQNWSPTARLLAGSAGAAALGYCISRRKPTVLALGTTGAALLARALTNRDLKRLVGVGGGRNTVQCEKTITIAAPIEEVFRFWKEFRNFPLFMSHVREVSEKADGKSHWVVDAAAGVRLEWDAVTTKLVPNKTIAWKTVPNSSIDHAGIVSFRESGKASTTIHLEFYYKPPAGQIGHSIAALLGFDPKTKMDEDMAVLKTMLETRKTPERTREVFAGERT